MRECLGCLGDGYHDFRDMDTLLEEHLPPAALAFAKATARHPWRGRVECAVCGGTGLITDDEWRDRMAAARAAVDQISAEYERRVRRGEL